MRKSSDFRRNFRQLTGSFIENAVTDNIVLTQALGLCPIIAAGISLQNGVALTVCTALILIPQNLMLYFLGNRIPGWLRPVVYAVTSALLLVGGAYLMGMYISPELYAHLYLFIPLLTVNTVYSHHMNVAAVSSAAEAVVDGFGSSVGFGLVICAVSALREMAISHSLWGIPLGYTANLPEAAAPFAAFILLGFMAALLQWARQRIAALIRRKEESV